MKRLSVAVIAAALLGPSAIVAQQEENYDYWQFNRAMIRRGQQAIFTCNGLFTSNRNLQQVFDQELAFLPEPIGTPEGGDYVVDWDRKAVAIGADDGVPTMRAAFRDGLGCVILAPDQTFDDIDDLPILDTPPLEGDPAAIPWPDGDLVENQPIPQGIDAGAIQAASDWAFHRESPEQVTVSLLVVHKGKIIHERYAPGFDMTTLPARIDGFKKRLIRVDLAELPSVHLEARE